MSRTPEPNEDRPAGTLGRRLLAGAMLAGTLAVLAVGASLQADADGYGTHVQLDLPVCSFRQSTGYPCPTCGCTTAFSLAAHGRLLAGLHTQPFGALLALAVAMTAVVAGYVAISGAPVGAWWSLLGGWGWAWGIAGLFVVSWLYKLAQTAGVLS